MTSLNVFKSSKKLVKKLLVASRRSYIETFHAFNADALKEELHKLGITQGQAVLVHSSFSAFEGFNDKPSDVVKILENLVGSSGTILMPSIPFTGTAINYVRSGKITDVMRTPSRNGLLTEVFRRQKGTLRSLHPTHPVLARGARATAMLADHHHATTPCGEKSPFSKLLEEKGKILFLGTSIEAMTFFHYLEERYEDRLDPSPFSTEIFEIQVKNGNRSIMVKTRLFDTNLSRRRSIMPILPELRLLDGCTSRKIGVLQLFLVDAVVARDAFKRCLDNKIRFYG